MDRYMRETLFEMGRQWTFANALRERGDLDTIQRREEAAIFGQQHEGEWNMGYTTGAWETSVEAYDKAISEQNTHIDYLKARLQQVQQELGRLHKNQAILQNTLRKAYLHLDDLKQAQVQATRDADCAFRNLDRVQMRGAPMQGVVLIGTVQKRYDKSMNPNDQQGDHRITVVDESGCGSTYSSQDAVRAVWERVK